MSINFQEVKKTSEDTILKAGGEILPWLPIIDWTEPRIESEIVDRALVVNAIYQVFLGAPKDYILQWLSQNKLLSSLTSYEHSILDSSKSLTEEEQTYLYWLLESLWTIAWATQLVQELPFNQSVGDELASLSPNLQVEKDGRKYKASMKLRNAEELYSMRDLYYRLHWWANQNIVKNQPSVIEYPIIFERRKTLEWIMDRNSDWDSLDLGL
ncbi:DUF4272 domain-containing protein [Legionella sp. 16cNR16C]|uniref:DUF4272 domain-containing protein n=1 Tax=Legionella sp. 16cNR16C TaxID=2905656 RepID=UPI001E519134|nr:DUF4272 domain-containing protein [Legionella sp. 16cNR16C]MCE3044186.1 DUF4272 domain-containing protein [Legionella sp. 16cNR16C]